MDFTITIAAAYICATLAGLFIIGAVLLVLARFALKAEVWDGFWTLDDYFLKFCVKGGSTYG